MKRTHRIEVVRVSRRVVSRTGSDALERSGSLDIDLLLSALDTVPSLDESRKEIEAGAIEIPCPPSRSPKPKLSRLRERLSSRFKARRGNDHEK